MANEANRKAIQESASYLKLGRQAIVDDLEGFRQVSILDFFEEDDRTHRLKLKKLEDLKKLSRHHQRWIKKIVIKDEIDGQKITIEGLDMQGILDKAGKYLGMWEEGDKTVNVQVNNFIGVSDAELVEQIRTIEAEVDQ